MSEQPLWQPSPERLAGAPITAFMKEAGKRAGRSFAGYGELYQWSIDQPGQSWPAVWDFCQVIASAQGERVLVDGDKMPGAKWFPEARLNFAQN
ncbi:MAG: acetyl-coenzyme A synthetase N-terminal domain-containing protein, partial [Pseudomonadota bacterium]